jgi:glycosyltransferase involved in cell wall biosynthesis
MRPALEKKSAQLGLDDRVSFLGGLPFDNVLAQYELNDVLVLVSETEGWPKAIAEAMAFGLVCIGTDRGWVREMLGDGRGFVVPPGDAPALAGVLGRMTQSPEILVEMSRRSSAWSERFSLEGLREALRDLLEDKWQASLMGRSGAERVERS